MRTAVRIKDIARDVQLPMSTVGNILRNDTRYGKELRERVMGSARRLGYRPNIMARGLKGGNTQSVGILFSLGGPHSPSELVRMIAGSVHKHHYVTQVSDNLFDIGVTEHLLRDYIRRGVDAVAIQISSHMKIDEIEDLFPAFNAVVLVSSIPTETNADQIVLSREQAIRDAVDHLIDTGRKRPMILVPPGPREEKIEPFLRRLRERGCTYEAEPTILHQSHPAARSLADVAFEALEMQCPDSVPFDALICGTDEAAVAAYKWLDARGRKIPHDVAVVGFNDSTYAKFMMPALASINRQDEEVARLIEKMLFDRLEHPDLPPRIEDVLMTFVPRDSAG
jgi:DNA-binding LacI/PurR family transcriptional regulator